MFQLYIDPGSGSYLVQLIIAGVLGVVFFFKRIGHFFSLLWFSVKSFFSKSDKTQN
jgi:hypothetical protein